MSEDMTRKEAIATLERALRVARTNRPFAGDMGERLLIAAAGDIAALVERWQAQNRQPTDEELLLLATRRKEEDQALDALLRSLGVEPGTGRRIPRESPP